MANVSSANKGRYKRLPKNAIDMKMSRGLLPGEPNPSAPMKGGGKRPEDVTVGPEGPGGAVSGIKNGGKPGSIPGGKPTMSKDPMPVSPYDKMKMAFQTPGMQPGEGKYISAIMKKRGVGKAAAQAIGKRRTSAGLRTAGVPGPVVTPPKPVRVNLPKGKPMPMPKRPGTRPVTPPAGTPKRPVGGRPIPKRPPVSGTR